MQWEALKVWDGRHSFASVLQFNCRLRWSAAARLTNEPSATSAADHHIPPTLVYNCCVCRLAKTIHSEAVKAMVEPQEPEAAAATAADLAAAYELVCRARDCRAELSSAMEVDGQGQQAAAAAAADSAAVAGGIVEKVLQLEAKASAAGCG